LEDLLISINYRDPAWVAVAFLFGLLFKQIKLPPMVGFLFAGFILHILGAQGDDFLNAVADLGVTLLLFTIGLKLRLKNLLKTEIWATTGFHMIGSILVTLGLILALSAAGILIFDGIDLSTALILAFALSFSSTVFAIKTMEDRGALTSRYGQISMGILVMQDIVAVCFLAISAGKVPSIWAIALLALIPGRHILGKLLELSGHKELLIIYGFVLALGGAALFEMVGMKGDLGALVFGMLLGGHKKGKELAGTLMSFKDVFLVCFFLTIGLTGLPTWETTAAAALLLLLIPFKTVLFYGLLTRFRVRARGSTLASISLGNYSEFGLIVIAIAISSGWLDNQWLTVMAVALSASFVLASPISVYSDNFYAKYRETLRRFESKKRLPGDENISLSGHTVLIFGMGRVGSAAYDELYNDVEGQILGVDLDQSVIEKHIHQGRNIILGDASNPEFWSRLEHSESDIKLILLAMPNHDANLRAAQQLLDRNLKGKIVATAKYKDEVPELLEAGIDEVFNIYDEAGSGVANHIKSSLLLQNQTNIETSS
jgi:predicted Kef-type K+ transport protein